MAYQASDVRRNTPGRLYLRQSVGTFTHSGLRALVALALLAAAIASVSCARTRFCFRRDKLKKVRGIDFSIGPGVAWNREDLTASRDDIVDIARSLVRPGR